MWILLVSQSTSTPPQLSLIPLEFGVKHTLVIFIDNNTESRQLSVTEYQDLNSDVVECGFHFSIEIKQK